MATAKLGRPRHNPKERRLSASVAMGSSLIKWLDETARAHGVSRSQIVDDAIKVYRGEMDAVLRHLREELSSQENNVKVLEALGRQKDEELTRLRASQQMVGNILSPYGVNSELSKEAKEKARTLRAVRNNPGNILQVQMLSEGRLDTPTVPILADAFNAWGSWNNLLEAIKAAEGAAA